MLRCSQYSRNHASVGTEYDRRKYELNILGFAGSLRKGSYNRSRLRAAGQLLPKDTTLEVFDLSDIPPFNQDLEADMPTKVKEFKTKIRESDAILIATPEYNYSVPGVLKNAIDYASRPYGDNPFDDKPVAIMSASVGMLGGASAQYHLRQMFVFLNMHPINFPEVILIVIEILLLLRFLKKSSEFSRYLLHRG